MVEIWMLGCRVDQPKNLQIQFQFKYGFETIYYDKSNNFPLLVRLKQRSTLSVSRRDLSNATKTPFTQFEREFVGVGGSRGGHIGLESFSGLLLPPPSIRPV